MITHPSEYWEACYPSQYSGKAHRNNPLNTLSTPQKGNTMNRTRTPKALHPSILIVNGTAIDCLTNRTIAECDSASASEWQTVLNDISARRWAKDSQRTPERAQRTPRNWV